LLLCLVEFADPNYFPLKNSPRHRKTPKGAYIPHLTPTPTHTFS
jgi:hypothetical protein